MTTKQISILGCGWLGLPLAKYLIAQNYNVKGSTTSNAKEQLLKDNGITPYVFSLATTPNEKLYTDFLEGSSIVIINFPPKRVPDIVTVYQEQMNRILPFIKADQKVIFVSSTSVYQNTNDWVTEDLKNLPEKNSGHAVLAVETMLKNTLKSNVTILRLSGLIGYDRVPGRFLANKKEVKNGKAPINVIHQDDCIGLIKAIIDNNAWGEVINGCADEHPTRELFYVLAAEKEHLTPPQFIDTEEIQFKKVSNVKSKTLLKYTYKYPDPLVLVK